MTQKPKPLDLEDIWEQLREMFGRNPLGSYYSYKTSDIIIEVLHRVELACKFYLRYKDKPILFWNEQKKYRKQFKKKFGDVIIAGKEMRPFYDWKDQYNEWLFKLAFWKVTENARKE